MAEAVRPDADVVIENARQVLTCAGPAPLRGASQRLVSALAGAVVAGRNGRIVFAGPAGEADRAFRARGDARIVDARQGTVLPGFVDAHTHVVFAGDRAGELSRRLAGETYEAIGAAGGGIVETVRATRAASEDELFTLARGRLDDMLLAGTTTCEAKSGYGLDLPSELKMLRVIARLNSGHPVDVSPTFLGAHEIPLEHRETRARYIESIVDDMIPAVAASGLAEWCDVFCERGVFTPDEARAILETGRRYGLRPRIHADELGPSGGWRVAAELGARSADHLVFVDGRGARGLAAAGVVATLLPSAPLFLKLGRFAPARTLIDAGVAVALGTDVNPGGGHSPAMPFAMTLACFAMQMTLEEAIVAATVNAAYALDRQASIGSLEPGKLLDALIIAGQPADLVRIGARTIRTVVKRGRVVVEDFQLTPEARDTAWKRDAGPAGAVIA
jgi:imidazolonepropionase